MKQWIWVSPILVATVMTALSGCGKQSYGVIQSQQDSGAPGGTSIAPKVDLVLAIDNTGSTYSVQAGLNASIRNFLTQLNAQNWDFRVTAIPLTGTPTISQISASKYDANSANWVAPFPGAPHTSTIPQSMYVSPENFQVSVNTTQTDGVENGLRNIGTALASATAQQYFIRPEAILAVIVLSNGEDSSDGVDYSAYPNLPFPTISSGVITGIKNAKGSALASTVHLIPVVSPAGSRNCSALGGGTAWAATRYVSAGAQIGGHSAINICTTPMTSVLAQIQSQVSAIKLSFVKRYIQLSARPNEATISIVKKASNGAQITVPKSVNGSAGWVYLGETTAPMVSEPIQMDFRTGYMVQLIGDAYKLTGDETATVTFLPYGIQPSN